MGDHHQAEGMIDGGLPPLKRVMNIQKRVREFGQKDEEDMHMTNVAARRKSGQSSQSDRPTHHSEEYRRVYPTGLHTKLQPTVPGLTRRKSEGDAQSIPERPGKVGYNRRNLMGGDATKVINVPPELIRATIQPMGVPLETEQLSGEIQAETGNELIIHSLEEMGDRKDPERAWGKATKYTTYALRGFISFNVAFGR